MPATCDYAASVARGCAQNVASQEYRKLSGMMCWDAVTHCALLAGIVNQQQYSSLLGRGNTLVTTVNPGVTNAAAMGGVPAGHFLAFFENKNGMWTMVHAMISTGFGMAAGNKNDCVGVGHAVGWELLNLSQGLNWAQGGHVRAPLGMSPTTGQMVYRDIHIHHRPITDLAFI